MSAFTTLSTPDLVARLRTCGLDVPPGLPEAVIARGDEAVAPLAATALDPDLMDAESDPECWASIHASILLGAVGGRTAAESLALIIRTDQVDDILGDWLPEHIGPALGFCGPDAFDLARDLVLDVSLDTWHRGAAATSLHLIAWQHPGTRDAAAECLSGALNRAMDEDWATELAISLSSAWWTDDRIRKAIERAYDRHLIDLRCMPRKEAFERRSDTPWEIDPPPKSWADHFSPEELDRLREVNAEDALDLDEDNPLDPEEDTDPWQDPAPPTQPRRVEKIGRNAPCPCGSGKKYKRCCLGSL